MLFTVRIWSEQGSGGIERRGSVRAVETGAFRSFREWDVLTAFLAEQLETETADAPSSYGAEPEETPWPTTTT